ATGKNFVFSDKISGTVTVVSPNPVTVDEAYAVFQAVLSVRGLTTIDDGIVTRVVPLKEAKTAGGALVGEAPGTAGFATRLISLEHVEAAEAARVLATLVSKEGSLVAYPATNTLIVSETVANLDKISAVVSALDIPRHEQAIEVTELDHAAASVLAEQITDILTSGPSHPQAKDKRGALPTQSFAIVPDERTNALIVSATGNELARIRELVKALDAPTAPGDDRLHVYYARHADAVILAEVVSRMISGRRRAQAKTARRTPSGTPDGFTDEVSITADPATNAIIVGASAHDYRTLRSVLESLDIQLAQVFVETIIVEVSMDYADSLGFEFQAGGDIGKGAGIARSSLSMLNALANPTAIGGLILAATSDKTIQLPDGTEIPAQAALFTALATDSNINVLSAPTLLTLDNQKAEILVGENVPFVTSQGVDLGNIDNVFTTVEREDVGIKLSVTPQVGDGDVVILEIEEEVSALVDNSLLDAAQVGPTTSVRSAKTTVSVANGRTAVIGGLISDSLTERDSKIPFLGDIPWLGRLFRSEASRKEKVNLIVFLTPHIIRNENDMAEVTSRRRKMFSRAVGEIDDDSSSAQRDGKASDDRSNATRHFPNWPGSGGDGS
ncbi:MAG: type II secretion system secretin GspD, partial [Candidatus Binatia bacterium]